MSDTITPKTLRDKRNEYIVIDVREAEELNEGIIEDSIHLPLGMLIKKAKKGMMEEFKGKNICTHCSAGYRSNIAAHELNKWGFRAVSIEGGFKAWKQEQ